MATYKKILLVDDDNAILSMLTMALEGHGYVVKALAHAEKVFNVIDTYQPDLILLDGHLGAMDGKMICSALKFSPHTKDIPVIFVSGSYHYASNLNVAGAPDDFVLKPFDIDYLLGKIEHQLAA
jgi:DNA-binding response OmpR family regulator